MLYHVLHQEEADRKDRACTFDFGCRKRTSLTIQLGGVGIIITGAVTYNSEVFNQSSSTTDGNSGGGQEAFAKVVAIIVAFLGAVALISGILGILTAKFHKNKCCVCCVRITVSFFIVFKLSHLRIPYPLLDGNHHASYWRCPSKLH